MLNFEDAVARIRSWQPPDLLTADYSAALSLLQAHAITLRMNRLHERLPTTVTTLEQWLSFNAVAGLWGDSSLAIPPEASTNFAKAMRNCQGRTYVRTKDGHIGLAPLDTQAGEQPTRPTII